MLYSDKLDSNRHNSNRHYTQKLSCLLLLIVALSLILLLAGSGLDVDYIIPKRFARLTAIIIGSLCVALSSIIFQTLVNNRILTPAIMGYEAVYLMWQALLLLTLGTHGLAMLGTGGNFFISLALMLVYSWLLQRWLLGQARPDLYRLLLIGLVLTMVISTFTQFVQLRIDPGEFAVLQGLSYASFTRANTDTLLYSIIAVTLVCVIGYKYWPELDALTLGQAQATSLGVNTTQLMRLYLALIAILVSVSTSLIGPTAFLGIFVANITYALSASRKHRLTLPMGCAIAMTLFLVAQLLVEHVFNYRTTVTILINLVCGAYFLMLIVRTRGTL
ncbi:iron ABC transporter permease [Terasakiispira papahanaumokuakeensis]|uniref:Iron ABC transporter permease n=1 Tax=Terasakiispira papahanaumokuakeensis TaxID=197479 RepID=A0A1E2V5J2_9GAMM|nr:iron chelate uptake ABC transporter family permease subunit [Terasakiispira papahanaumokuakeensis]ODC02270.1 iron ABC transporter permease [Terasakiispira papahanaumokuakeensis]